MSIRRLSSLQDPTLGIEQSRISPAKSPPLPTPSHDLPDTDVAFQAKEIGWEVLAFFRDEKWMGFVTDMLAIGSHICSLMEETRATECVPYISIISGPLYLYHAIIASNQKCKLMVSAYKTSRVVDAFFWGSGAIGSLGIALGKVVKPIAGGVILFGLKGATLNLVFSFVIPIILITFSVIGGMNQTWARGRTEMAQLNLTQRKTKLRSLKHVEAFLSELLGPQEGASEDSLAKHNYKLDVEHFQNTHFTSDGRRKAVQKRIENLLGSQENNGELTAARAALGQILGLMRQTQAISTEVLATSTQGSLFEQIDKTLSLSDKTIRLAQKKGLAVEDLILGREKLVTLKRQLLQEGFEIVEAVESEIHRKIAMQNIGILNALITLGAGILFLIGPKSQYYLGYILSLSASAIGAINIMVDKSVSHNHFLRMEQFLGLVKKAAVPDPNGFAGKRRAPARGCYKDLA